MDVIDPGPGIAQIKYSSSLISFMPNIVSLINILFISAVQLKVINLMVIKDACLDHSMIISFLFPSYPLYSHSTFRFG